MVAINHSGAECRALLFAQTAALRSKGVVRLYFNQRAYAVVKNGSEVCIVGAAEQ